MSAYEAAVRAVAYGVDAALVEHQSRRKRYGPELSVALAEAALAALATNPDVRAALMEVLDRSCGEDGCTWFAHRPGCATDAILAALRPPEVVK